MDFSNFLALTGHRRIDRSESSSDLTFLFVKESCKEIQKLIPLSTLFFQWEDADDHGKHFEMEDKVIKVLSCMLLSNDLEVALLEALEVKPHETS